MSARRSLLVLAALVAARPATAFVRSASDSGKALFWPLPAVAYNVNPAQSAFSESCAGPQGGGEGAVAAVRASFDAWRQSCSNLELAYAGLLDEIRIGQTGPQGENVVVFRRGFCSQHPQARVDPCMTDVDVDCGNLFNCFEDHGSADQSTLALTSVLYQPSTGRIVDADIEVVGWDGTADTPLTATSHGTYFTCVDPGAAPSGRCTTYGQTGCYHHDLQNTVTHEVGHFVGLRHVCYAGNPSDADLPPCAPAYAKVTMYPTAAPGDVDKRSLDPDDVAGVCAAYPLDGGGGGCGCGSGGGTGMAALLALLALRRSRRRAAGAPHGRGRSP